MAIGAYASSSDPPAPVSSNTQLATACSRAPPTAVGASSLPPDLPAAVASVTPATVTCSLEPTADVSVDVGSNTPQLTAEPTLEAVRPVPDSASSPIDPHEPAVVSGDPVDYSIACSARPQVVETCSSVVTSSGGEAAQRADEPTVTPVTDTPDAPTPTGNHAEKPPDDSTVQPAISRPTLRTGKAAASGNPEREPGSAVGQTAGLLCWRARTMASDIGAFFVTSLLGWSAVYRAHMWRLMSQTWNYLGAMPRAQYGGEGGEEELRPHRTDDLIVFVCPTMPGMMS